MRVGGDCAQSGKRFEMRLEVRNHSGLGVSPDLQRENPGAWEVTRGKWLMLFVEEKHGRDGRCINYSSRNLGSSPGFTGEAEGVALPL